MSSNTDQHPPGLMFLSTLLENTNPDLYNDLVLSSMILVAMCFQAFVYAVPSPRSVLPT